MWRFSNSADLVFIRPLSPCSEASPEIPLPQVSSLPALVALKLVSTVHVEELAHGLDVMGALH
jgi:hypothetical protein